MPWLIVACPHLVPRQTLIVPQMGPFADLAEIATRVLAVTVEVIRILALKVPGWKRCQVALTHDLLANVINTVTCHPDGQQIT